MKKTSKGNKRLNEALLEMAHDYRGTLLSEETADKITMRVLGEMIPVDETIARWRKDPAYMKVHVGLEEEFALLTNSIKARTSKPGRRYRQRKP